MNEQLSLYSRLLRKYRGIKAIGNNVVLKNIHNNERCFIIGNGPSVKIQDISKLKNEWTFVTNGFYLHEQYNLIHPKFYVIMDPKHFSGDADSVKFVDNLQKKLHNDTILFFHLTAKDFIEKNQFFPKNKKYYLNATGVFEENKHNNTNIDKKIPGLQSVSVGCLIIAKYMGFDPIYLMGLEHNWLATRANTDPTKLYTSPHFYDTDKHYLNGYVIYSYEDSCWCQYNLYKSYRLIKRETSAKIINLTPESYLDVFPFATYEEIVK